MYVIKAACDVHIPQPAEIPAFEKYGERGDNESGTVQQPDDAVSDDLVYCDIPAAARAVYDIASPTSQFLGERSQTQQRKEYDAFRSQSLQLIFE